jgi:hypothetical protein
MHTNPFPFSVHSCHTKFVRMQQETNFYAGNKFVHSAPNCINTYTI